MQKIRFMIVNTLIIARGFSCFAFFQVQVSQNNQYSNYLGSSYFDHKRYSPREFLGIERYNRRSFYPSLCLQVQEKERSRYICYANASYDYGPGNWKIWVREESTFLLYLKILLREKGRYVSSHDCFYLLFWRKSKAAESVECHEFKWYWRECI